MRPNSLRFRLFLLGLKTAGLIFPGAVASWAYKEWFRTRRFQAKPDELAFQQSGTACHATITIRNTGDPTKIHYRRFDAKATTTGPQDNDNDNRDGDGDDRHSNRPPLILCMHGWNGRGSQFHKLIPTLQQRGYCCITLDAPGHGSTHGDSSTIFAFADAIHAVLELELTNNRKFAGLIGHSFGGLAGTYALDARPDLRPAHLALIASPSSAQGLIDAFIDQLQLPKGVTRRFIAKLYTQFPESLWNHLTAKQLCRKLDMPSLVIHDSNDPFVPQSQAEAYAKALSKVERMETQGLGHFRILRATEVAERIAELIDTAE